MGLDYTGRRRGKKQPCIHSFDSAEPHGYACALMPAELDRAFEPAGLAARDYRLVVEEGLAAWPRLLETAERPDGAVRVQAEFNVGAGGGSLMAADLSATFAVRCQRCLEPLELELRTAPRLAFGTGGVDPPGYESCDLDDGVTLRHVLEDELLLAMPPILVHAHSEDCGPLAGKLVELGAEGAEDRQSPFAALAALKRKD